MQPPFQDIAVNYINSLPISEEISERIFSIPMHPYLTDKEINKICNTLIEAKNEL